jgi:hypothetical protein
MTINELASFFLIICLLGNKDAVVSSQILQKVREEKVKLPVSL